jgi:hypothetical protein
LDAARALPLWTGQQGQAPDTRFSRFALPRKPGLATLFSMTNGKTQLPEFHPQTVLRDWGNGEGFRLGMKPPPQSSAVSSPSIFINGF